MSESKIKPHQVTKPIQLLAAWLTGLVLVNGAFLGTAAAITEPIWASGALVIAAILNVPIFVGCIFVLQTRYRPEMQEDTYYSEYLDRQTRTMQSIPLRDVAALRTDFSESIARILELIESIQNRMTTLSGREIASSPLPDGDERDKSAISERIDDVTETIASAKLRAQWERYTVYINDLLPEYSHIQEVLRKVSIPISKTFGTTSDLSVVPTVGLLSFGKNVEVEEIAFLVDLLKNYGIEYMAYSDHEMHQGNIYIGSYAYDLGGSGYTPISGVVEAALADPETTTEAFVAFLRGRISDYMNKIDG